MPDVKDNAFELLGEIWCTKEERIVQPSVFTISWSLELGSCLEVKRWLAIGILITVNDSTITNVDNNAVVCLDTVDGLEFCAINGCIGNLVISATIDNRSLNIRPFESAACNGDNGASSMLGLTTGIGISKSYFQL